MKKGDILRGPPCEQIVVLALDDFESADAGADEDAYAVGVLFVDVKARLRHGLGDGGKGKVDEAPHLARFLLIDKLQGVEVLDFGGKGDREAGGVKALDGRPPLAPARICRHTSGAVLPTPQSSPTPVTTTLRGDVWE